MSTSHTIHMDDPYARDVGCIIGGSLALLLLVAFVVALLELLRWRTGAAGRRPLLPLVAGEDVEDYGLHKGALWVVSTDG